VDLCLCDDIPRVVTRTHVVIVRHALEAPKPSNTGRLAAMALTSSELHDHGRFGVALPPSLFTAPGTCLLYPDGPPTVPAPPPQRLIVLDGSWSQARRMLHRIPELRRLPRLCLPAPDQPRRSLRRAPAPHQMSTLQAITSALRLLEGPAVARPLEELHALVIERSARAGKRF
jgi:DTW domain-containing protein YfiP